MARVCLCDQTWMISGESASFLTSLGNPVFSEARPQCVWWKHTRRQPPSRKEADHGTYTRPVTLEGALPGRSSCGGHAPGALRSPPPPGLLSSPWHRGCGALWPSHSAGGRGCVWLLTDGRHVAFLDTKARVESHGGLWVETVQGGRSELRNCVPWVGVGVFHCKARGCEE